MAGAATGLLAGLILQPLVKRCAAGITLACSGSSHINAVCTVFDASCNNRLILCLEVKANAPCMPAQEPA